MLISDNIKNILYKDKDITEIKYMDKTVWQHVLPIRTMTAVIDQASTNPLTCITYEDDAKTMTKGSADWDKFFDVKLVLFKDGKEIRMLNDSELNSLSDADGDVMVKFKRMGLNIKTVGSKVYVTMTDNPNDPNFKYYAHTRGSSSRDAFYLGAYLGIEKNGKLRSVKGGIPTGNKTIGDFRTIAQANGKGYEMMAFFQWMMLQAMYVLKYGNLDSQTALGKGLTGGDIDAGNLSDADCKNTGTTNGKGIDFGSANDKEQVRFQYIEDFYGNKAQWCDGYGIKDKSLWIGNDNFNNEKTGYKQYPCPNGYGIMKEAVGTSDQGFIPKTISTDIKDLYGDLAVYMPEYSPNAFALVGGCVGYGADAGAFFGGCGGDASYSGWAVGARLMFL